MTRNVWRGSMLLGIIGLMCSMSQAETKSGKVELQVLKDNVDVPVAATLGTSVKVVCRFYYDGNFFGSSVVSGNAQLTNTSKEKVFYSYNVAFFDAQKNLVGCASENSGNQALKPGESTATGSALIFLPPDAIKSIGSFQVTWFETNDKAKL